MSELNSVVQFPNDDSQPRDFVLQNILFKDKEAIVYEAKPQNPQNPQYQVNVAIKIYDKINQYEEDFIDWLMIQQKQHLESQIIDIKQKIEFNNKKCIMMELGKINLQEYLKSNQNLSCAEKLNIFLQIFDAIKFLHKNEYFSGEIKSENFVKVENHFKLCSFGFKKNYEVSQIDINSLRNLFCEIFQGGKQIKGLTEQESISEKNPDSFIKDIETISKNNDIECQQIQKIPNTQQKQQQTPQVQYFDYQQIVNSILEAPAQEFPKRQFLLTKLLGDGGEGGVYQATPRNETFYNKDIALKMQLKMKDQEIQFIDFLIDFQKNQEQNQFIKSNLIKVYERFELQGKQVLIMELGGKDLLSVLKNKLQVEQKVKICQEIAQSIAFLHKQQLIHRDIKPENFIQVGTIFKLIDFGLIKKREENVRLTKMIGSPPYQAPEIINGSENYYASVDIWSLGCLFFELFKEEPLFYGKHIGEIQQQILKYCQNQQQVHLLINQLPIKLELKNLIKQMIDPIPEKRPNIDYIQKELLPKFLLNSNNKNEQTSKHGLSFNQGQGQQFQQVQIQGQQFQYVQGQQFQQGQVQLQGQQFQQGQNQFVNNQPQLMQNPLQNQQFQNNQKYLPPGKP